MLALVSAGGARLDAGSVGLALSRRWSDAGDPVLFVDADTSGSRLAERFGEAVRADYSPAVRGLPSLIVAREPLTLRLLADHCYSLDASKGSLWALFAPSHPDGAQHAARWMGERAEDLMAVHRERRVVLASSMPAGGAVLAPLLRAAPILVVLAPVQTREQAKGLWTMCRDAGLMGFDRKHRVLIVDGASPLADEEIRTESQMNVAGWLPLVDDEKVLRLQGGRKERAFMGQFDKIADRLLPLARLDAASAAPAPADEAAAVPGLHGLAVPPGGSAFNGAQAVPGRRAGQVPEASREGTV